MKNKKLIWTILAAVSVVLLILPLVLNFWTAWAKFMGETQTNSAELFVDMGGSDSATWATLTGVCAIIALVVAVLLTVSIVLDMLNVGKIKYALINRVLSIVALVVTVLAVVFAIVACANGAVVIANETIGGMTFGIGAYMLVAGGLVSAVAGFLASRK